MRAIVTAVLLALLGIALYANSFQVPFVLDGNILIRNDRVIEQIWPWKMSTGLSRPIGFLTFGLNYALSGKNVWGYHAANLAIHTIAAWLLFDLVRRTLLHGKQTAHYAPHAWGLATAVALIWLAHPLQTNAVTYLYQRLESLMALFYLATLWCFARALDSPKRAWWYAASTACCAIGMGCKEVMATAPLVVLWYDRVSCAQSWRELFSQRGKYYAALAATWGVLVFLVLHNHEYESAGVLIVKGVSPVEYARSQPGVILHYLRLAFWPDRLCLDYCWPVATSAGEILPAALAVGSLVCLTAWASVRWPAWGFLGGCFFLVLAPTSTVIPLRDLAFEHRMYLPLACLVVATVLLAFELGVKLQRTLRIGGRLAAVAIPALTTIVVVGALGCRTLSRNLDYQTDVSLWENTVATRPQSTRAWVSLGHAYLDLGMPERTVRDCTTAISLNPATQKAYYTRAEAYSRLNRNDLAIADYSKAIELDPQDAWALIGRGLVLLREHHPQQSLDDLNTAIHCAPDRAEAYNGRSAVYGSLGKYQEALADGNRAIELNPRYALGYVNRGNALRQLGQIDAALQDYGRALQLDPAAREAHAARATVYFLSRDYERAIADFTRSIEIDPKDASSYKNRAVCWFQLGQFERARADVEQCEKFGGHPAPGFIDALKKALSKPPEKS